MAQFPQDRKQEPKCVDLNSVMERVGSFGRYQKLMVLLLCIPFTFNWCLNYWVHYLILITPPHQCSLPGINSSSVASALIPTNEDGGKQSCHRFNVSLSQIQQMDANQTDLYLTKLREEGLLGTMSCDNGWEFDMSSHFRTAVVDYEWVCEHEWKKYTTTTLFFVGMVMGLISFGTVSDRYGRLPVCIVTNLVACIGSLTCIFCPNFYTFAAARFIMGLTENCVYMMPFILVMEYLPPRVRGLVSPLTFSVFPALVNGALPWIALWIGNWSPLLLYSAILGLALAIPACIFMPESASWMLTHDQVERTYSTVQKIAKFNGKDLSEQESKDLEEDLYAIRKTIENQPEANLSEIIKSKNVRFRFLICVCVSMIGHILYDGHARNLELLPVSSYITFTLFAALFIPSQIFSGIVMNRYGRRPTVIISFGITCVLNSVIAFVDLDSKSIYLSAGFLLTAEFFNVASYSTIMTIMSEVLPTVIRARAVTLATCASALGLTTSPQIIFLGTKMRGLPSIVFAIVSFIGACLTVLLPETLGKPLPQTLEDGEMLGIEKDIVVEKVRVELPEKVPVCYDPRALDQA